MREFSRRQAVAGILTSAALARGAQAQTPLQTLPPRRLVGVPSQQFQFAVGIEDVIAMAKDAGFDAIEWNVRDGAHVPPVRVARDLPRAVELTHKAGLKTLMVATAIQDAQSPYAEDILKAMQSVGIRFYRSSNYFRYDYSKDVAAQLEALRPRIASIAALNAKYGTTICYHTHSPSGDTDLIGGNVWDLWTVLKDFDPALAGFNYDTAHTTIDSGDDWRPGAYVARRSIDGVAVKDFNWVKSPAGTKPYIKDVMCPLGEGLVDFKARFEFLRDIGFNGPINIHYEHHGMLETGMRPVGTTPPPAPRDVFVGLLKADLDYLRHAMQDAGYSS